MKSSETQGQQLGFMSSCFFVGTCIALLTLDRVLFSFIAIAQHLFTIGTLNYPSRL